MIRVALVDGDETFARIVRSAFEVEGFQVESYRDCASARAALASAAVDLLLLERDLPDGDALDIMAARAPRIPAIVVTRRGSEDDRVAGFAAGADDYVVKPVNVRELVARAQGILRRTHAGDRTEYESGSLTISLDAMHVIRDGVSVALSLGETAVLAVLIRHAPAAVPVTSIVAELHGHEGEVARSTIEARLKSLRRKVGNDVIESRPGLGYAFRG